MKTQHSFALSIAAHLVVAGAVLAYLAMPAQEIEEEIILELSMSITQAKETPLVAPSPTKPTPVVAKTKPVLPVEPKKMAQPVVKVPEPILKTPEPITKTPEPLTQTVSPATAVAQEVVAAPQAEPTVEKSESVTEKIQEPVVLEEEYLDNHLAAIRDILLKYRKYPNQAVRLKQEGIANISFRLTSKGEVEDIMLQSSSGYEILDSDALRLIEKTAHYFPRPPKSIRITVPLKYSLKNAS